ncbi:unnamed protein product, partial [marine sediment metagenome]
MSDDAKSMTARADSHFEKGNAPKALVYYRLARELTKSRPLLRELSLKIARTCATLKYHDDAVANYREAMKYSPVREQSNIMVEIARQYHASKNYRYAVAYFRKALEHECPPRFVGDVHYWLGRSLYKVPEMDTNDESLIRLEQAKSKPRNLVMKWHIHTTRGNALRKKERYDEALAEFRNALNTNLDVMGNAGHLYNSTAACYKAMGDEENAVRWYRKAIHAPHSKHSTKGWSSLQIARILRDSKPSAAQQELEEAKRFF